MSCLWNNFFLNKLGFDYLRSLFDDFIERNTLRENVKKFLNESGHLILVNCTGIIFVKVLEHRLESSIVELSSLGHIVQDINDESLTFDEVKSPRSINIILILSLIHI